MRPEYCESMMKRMVLNIVTNCQVQIGLELTIYASQKNSRFQPFLNCSTCLDSLIKSLFKLQELRL